MRELSLFSGAGGGCLASILLGHRIVGYVEADRAAQAILKARIGDGLLDSAPIFGDAHRFLGDGWAERYRGVADLVSGGFPCQPHSVAGRKLGAGDERDLWPATIAIIRAVRPRFAFLENVPGLATSPGPDGRPYIWRILADLHAAGFDAEWMVFGADDCGAPHRRKRLWILAHARRAGDQRRRIPGDVDGTAGCAPSEGHQRQRSGNASRDCVATVADSTEPRPARGAVPGTVTNPPRTGHRERNQSTRRGQSKREGDRLGDSGGKGLARRSRQSGDAQPKRAAAERTGGDAMAHADRRAGDRIHEREQPGYLETDTGRCGPGREAGSASGTRVGTMAHPDELRARGGVESARGDGFGSAGTTGDGDLSIGLWPPAPDDAAGWLRWLEHNPGTEPATPVESAFRGSADGFPGRMGQLRGLGNAQVPIVAAVAFRILHDRIGK